MPGAELVTRITMDTIDSVLNEEKPVFVACIREDRDYSKTLREIESLALFSGPGLRVCYALDDLLPYFEKRFGITGTPTFLIIKHGIPQDSLLGKTSVQGLMTFIGSHTAGPAGGNAGQKQGPGVPDPAQGRKKPSRTAFGQAASRKRRAL